MAPTILVLEDDTDIADLLGLHLKVMGYQVLKERSLAGGFKAFENNTVDAIVLDRGLTDGDGTVFCESIREQRNGLPIMMLTARDSESDMVEGLEAGADDYLTKPFSVIEFQARIRALLRRVSHSRWSEVEEDRNTVYPRSAEEEMLTFRCLEISLGSHYVKLNGEIIELTPTEFSLLYCLAKRPDRVFSKDELLSRVWNTDYDGYRHTVCCAVNRLRSKLESSSEVPKYIHTVWGVGYKFFEQLPDRNVGFKLQG